MKKIVILLILLLCWVMLDPPAVMAQVGEPSAWAIPFIQRASELELLPDSFMGRYTQPITRAQFCAIAVLTFENLNQSPITKLAEFYDTDDVDVSKLAGIGVVRGMAENIFEPERCIKREEAAVLLSNLMRALDRPLQDSWPAFADLSSIALWARREVGQVRSAGIMTGLGGNIFDPQGNLTIEQSVKTMLAVYDLVTAPERKKISVTDPALAGRRFPILMYHSIADIPTTSLTDLFVRPSELEAQLKYIAENGYQSITFEDLDNLGAFSKPVLLTFDDGYKDNYTILFPLLKKYGVKVTIFVVSGTVWNDSRLSPENIAEMSASGLVSIQSHTKNHRSLTALDAATLSDELSLSKEYLEELTGKPVIALCYPEGAVNAAVKAAAAKYYSYAVLNSGLWIYCGGDTLAMDRLRVSRGMSLAGFAALIEYTNPPFNKNL
jgi:peptidoglycan/xylan/chitin deacetylase (PgdA/CDA1 family)